MDIKIIGWTSFDCSYPTRKLSFEELDEIITLIKEDMYQNGYVFGGEDHQYGFTGVPVFSDGTCFRASMRCWGAIMAEMFLGPNDEKFTYMDFYLSFGDQAIMPEYSLIAVAPAENIIESFGCTSKQEREIIDQSLMMNMEFMTTDKVLKKLYEKKKSEL